MKLQKIITLFILLRLSTPACSDGCLKCTAEANCLLCDPTSLYKLESGACRKLDMPECSLIDFNGTCLQCRRPDWVVDLNQNKCLPVPDQNLVDKCARYSSSAVCVACARGYFVSDGRCVAISNVIANCNSQTDEITCLTCTENYLLSEDGGACLAAQPAVNNCWFYGGYKCNSCASGFILDRNLYINQSVGAPLLNQRWLSDFLNLTPQCPLVDLPYRVCRAARTANCVEENAIGVCTTCADGYVLKADATCSPKPVDAIPNCGRYLDAGTCIDCQQGFYLSSPKSCQAVAPVTNCVEYFTDASTSRCRLCAAGFFVESGGACQTRTAVIESCATFQKDADKCAACTDDKMATSDRLKCLPKLANCDQYADSNSSSISHRCLSCADQFALVATTGTCVTGTSPNCKRLGATPSQCEVCTNGFYFNDSGVCTAHAPISNCETFAQRVLGQCATCGAKSLKMTTASTCERKTQLLGCIEYSSDATCTKCDTGYYLNGGGCVQIAESENCLERNTEGCLRCKYGFVLESTTKSCRSPLNLFQLSCHTNSVLGATSSETEACDICALNSLPLQYTLEPICFDTAYLSSRNAAALPTSCVTFSGSLSSGSIKCTQCSAGFKLSNGACLAACPTTAKTTLPMKITKISPNNNGNFGQFKLETINECATVADECETASVLVAQDTTATVGYKCIECKAGFSKFVGLDSADDSFYPKERFSRQPGPRSLTPGATCRASTFKTLVGKINGVSNFVDNCDLYYQVPSQEVAGCLKCGFGFSGLVLDFIGNCRYQTAATCSECRQGFFLFSTSSCVKVTEIAKCLEYDPKASVTTCTSCENTHYLVAQTVDGKTVRTCNARAANYAGCTARTPDADTCKTCADTHILLGDTLCHLKIDNCIAYTLNGSNAVCSECTRVTHFVSSNACAAGTKNNCVQYAVSADSCLKCANTFWVNNSGCTAHSATISKCDSMSQSEADRCSTCAADSLSFDFSDKCVAVTVQNCATPATATTCTTCADNFRLTTTATCEASTDNCRVQLPVDLNSDSSINGQDKNTLDSDKYVYTCQKCKTGFYMEDKVLNYKTADMGSQAAKTVKICSALNTSYNLLNCDDSGSDGTMTLNNVYCGSKCSANTLPIDLSGKYTCAADAYFTARGSTAIANCRAYSYDTGSSKYTCAKCKADFALVSGACVDTCSGSFFKKASVAKDANDASLFSLSLSSTCSALIATSPEVTNCSIYTPASHLAPNLLDYCVKCAASKIPVVQFSKVSAAATRLDFKATSQTAITPLLPFPAIAECIDAGATILPNSQISNCRYFTKFADLSLGCVRCDFGKNGPVHNSVDSQSAVQGGYINECADDATCDANTKYDGLQLSRGSVALFGPLELLFSCHKCAEATKIPYARVEREGGGKIKGFASFAITDPVTSGGSEPSKVFDLTMNDGTQAAIACMTPDEIKALVFALPTLVDNCALGIIDLNADYDSIAADGLIGTKMLAVCAACKPGYSPAFNTNADFAGTVISCTEISNCSADADKGTWLNSCSKCALEWNDGDKSIKYGTCVQNAPSNCAVAVDASNCKFCKKGYELDATNKCVQRQVASCENSKFQFVNNFAALASNSLYNSQKNTADWLWWVEEIEGCESCSAGNSLILVDKTKDTLINPRVCLAATGGNFGTAVTFATANCKQYKVLADGSVKCSVCNDGSLVNTSFACVAQITNCILAAATAGKCETCANTFINVNGACVTDSPKIIGNCAEYDLAASKANAAAVCSKCAEGYDLGASGSSCVLVSQSSFPNCAATASSKCTKCKTNYSLFEIETDKFFCFPLDQLLSDNKIDSDVNCLELAGNAGDATGFRSGKLRCAKCAANLIASTAGLPSKNYCYPFLIASQIIAQCSVYNKATLDFGVNDPKCTTCANVATHYLNTGTGKCAARTAVTNCATYVANDNKCSACAGGRTLSGDGLNCPDLPVAAEEAKPIADNYGYIEACETMAGCDANVLYEGLTAPLSKIFSCHKCDTADKIPFAAVAAGASLGTLNGLKEFSLSPAANAKFDAGIGGKALTCLKPDAASLGISVNSFAFPNDCALGLLNVNSLANAADSTKATAVDKSKVAVVCVACKPGFKPASATAADSSTVSLMISSCSAIDSCQGTDWFNSCSRCADGYVYQYSSQDGINYGACVEIANNSGCFAASKSGNSAAVCTHCKSGFTLTPSNVCQQIKPPSCTSFSPNPSFELSLLTAKLGMGLTGFGCQSCGASYSLFRTTAKLCSVVPGLVATNNIGYTFLPHCSRYSGTAVSENQFKCSVCETGYLLTDAAECVVYSLSLARCEIAESATRCFKCNKGAANVNGTCLPAALVNCHSYSLVPQLKQFCLECDNGFYPKDGACVTGLVKDCAVFSASGACVTCNAGYQLLNGLSDFQICSPNDPNLNCLRLNAANLAVGILDCELCPTNTIIVPKAVRTEDNFCMLADHMPNCVKYPYETKASQSSLLCLECASAFFLSNGKCISRQFRVENCEIFSPTTDTCAKCQTGFYLTAAKTTCLVNPSGFTNCLDYDSSLKCQKCNVELYPTDTGCKNVLATQKIANCRNYSRTITCTRCIVGYFLQENTCVEAAAKNCLTFESLNTCATCLPGFGLSNESSLTNCVEIKLAHCITSTLIAPFACLRCAQGFYPSNGLCVQSLKLVIGCEVYISDSLCGKCLLGHVLRADGQACLPADNESLFDPNCADTVEAADGHCQACRPSYFFQQNECAACRGNSTVESCLQCDPTQQSKCFICAPGYVMGANQECSLPLENGGNSTIESPVKEARLMKLIQGLVVLLAFGIISL